MKHVTSFQNLGTKTFIAFIVCSTCKLFFHSPKKKRRKWLFKILKDFLFIINIQGRDLDGSLCTCCPSILFPFPVLLDWTSVWPICMTWILAGNRDLDENYTVLYFNCLLSASQSQEVGSNCTLSVNIEFLNKTSHIW